MAIRRSLANERDLRVFGESIARWREVLSLTAETTAERARLTELPPQRARVTGFDP